MAVRKLLSITGFFFLALTVIPALSSCSINENEKIAMPMEKWVSPQGSFQY